MSPRAGFIAFLLVYAGLGFGLELRLRRRGETAQRFLHTKRDLPLAITSLSFLAANCSALEVLSMVAISAKYGVVAVHFYWIGAIPALAFLLCVLLPRIRKLEFRSVPEYFEERYSKGARIVSALAFSALMVAVAGITLSLNARLLQLMLGLPIADSVLCTELAVVCFLFSGGLSAVLYAEALQLILFLLVLIPLTFRILHSAGGLHRVLHSLPVGTRYPFSSLPWMTPHAPADLFGVVVGLGCALSFTYWCADFLLIQRLYAARNAPSAMQTPVFTIFAKLFLPLLLVLPGLWIRAQHPTLSGEVDLELPMLLLGSYAPVAASAAVAVIVASLFLAVCGNIAAGAAILSPNTLAILGSSPAVDSGNLRAGKISTVALALLALPAAFLAFHADASMEGIQLVLSAFNVPVGVAFILGIMDPQIDPRSGLPGIVAGTTLGLFTWALCQIGHLSTGLNQSFYTAIISSAGTLFTMLLVHALGTRTAVIRVTGTELPLQRVNTRFLPLIAFACLTAMLFFYWVVER